MDNHEKAKFLLDDAETLQEQDMSSSLELLKEALRIAPDYPNLANRVFLYESSLKELDKTRDRIRQLISEAKYHTAFDALKNLPYGYLFEGKDVVTKDLTDRFNQAEKLVTEAKKLPRSEQLQAWTLLHKAAEIMPDLPDLQDRIRHIEDSTLELKASLDSIIRAIDHGETQKAQNYLESLKQLYVLNNDKLLELQQKIDKKKRERLIRVQGSIFGALIILATILFISREFIVINSAEKKWAGVNTLVGDGKYIEVEKTAQEVLDDMQSVHIIGKAKIRGLKRQISSLLSSESFIEAKKGNILFEGKYVAKESVQKARKLKETIDEAKKLQRQGQYIAAIEHYQQALPLVHEVKSENSDSLIFDIESSIYDAKLAKLDLLLKEADALFEAADYNNAIEAYNKALKFATVYGISTDQQAIVAKTKSAIHNSHQASFDAIIKKGNELLASEKYQTAYEVFNKASDYVKEHAITNPERLATLKKSKNAANLNRLIINGDQAYQASKWQLAFENYNQAFELAKTSGMKITAALDGARLKFKKADRLFKLETCKALITDADDFFKRREYEKSIAAYKKIPPFISQNRLDSDQEFASFAILARQKIKNAEELLFASSKTEFLNKNFMGILRKQFNLTGEINFLNPEITLLKSDANRLVYSISAISYQKIGREVNQTRYELYYVYDINGKRWQASKSFMDTNKKQEDQ